MQILIIGAGIIGVIYGWALAGAGHSVVHLVRPGRASLLLDGIKLDLYDTRKKHVRNYLGHYPLRLTEWLTANDYYDLVIVPTKHFKLVETLREIAPQIRGADFLLLTQNWAGVAEIKTILPPARFVYGDAKAGGAFEGGTLVGTLDSLDIGSVEGESAECLQTVSGLCQSVDLRAPVHAEMLPYLWVQYAITGGLWPALVRAGSFEVLLNRPALGRLAIQSAHECLEVVARRGVDLRAFPETAMYRHTSGAATWLASLGLKFMFRFSPVVRRSSLHALDDAEEIQAFYYDLLNTGRSLKVDMPVMSSFEPDIRRFAHQSSLVNQPLSSAAGVH
jgi:2-dehydropantoate 2-reductase